MDPNKKALADKLFRNVQIAHIQGVIALHHAPTMGQTLENYHAGFKSYTASPKAERTQERVRRFMSAEVPAVMDILAECYDPDRETMLANLAGRPELLDRMPVMSKYLARGGEGAGPLSEAPGAGAEPPAV